MRIRTLFAAAVALAVVWAVTGPAMAAVVKFDLRLEGEADAKTLTLDPGAADGRVFNFGLYAMVMGDNTVNTDEGFQSTAGKFTSSDGGLLVDISGNGSPGALLAPFKFFAPDLATPGVSQDLDGDTDKDYGGTLASDPLSGWFNATSGFSAVTTGSTVEGDYSVWRVAALKGTVQPGALAGQATEIQYTGLTYLTNTFIAAQIDGFPATMLWNDPRVQQGAPITVQVLPEPATLGLLAVAGLGVLARRRRRR